ncbi:MAG: SDR family oxidoreductase [Egibacteraceae bacterium]
MNRAILVTGGTGTLGRHVVGRLRDAGHDVRVASRGAPPVGTTSAPAWATVDYRAGAGLDAAIAAIEVIVHCARSWRGEVDRALIAAARSAGTPHLVYISIVGVDQVPYSYYRTKLAAEGALARSGPPWSVLRTTQFHDLVATATAWLSRLPVTVVPAVTSFQPIDVREVADRLAELATGSPAGRAPDMGGPQVRGAGDLARSYLRATGKRRPVLPIRLPGAAAAGFRRGGHLAPQRRVGRISFEQFLADRVACPRPQEDQA